MKALSFDLRRDERGMVFPQLAALIIAPIIALAVVAATLSMMRTGTGLTESLHRGALAQIMTDDFKKSVATASGASTVDAAGFVVRADPEALPPGVKESTSTFYGSCTSTEWDLVPTGDLVSLTMTRIGHVSVSCTSGTASSYTTTLTGLSPSSRFTYENRYGRELLFTGGVATLGPGTAPAGVTAEQWDDTTVAVIGLDATVQEMFGSRTVRATVFLP